MKHRAILGIALLFATASTLYAQTYKVLYSFGTTSGDPSEPYPPGMIAQSRGGYLFSTTDGGGFSKDGAAFRITTRGSLSVLHSFNGLDGNRSDSGLTLATDGQYYGATSAGGAYGYGTIFKMTQGGTITTLYSFPAGGADGGCPFAPPIQSQAGDFYGTTSGCGGWADPQGLSGSVYKITKYGEFTLLHTISAAEGTNPTGPLVQGTDYRFYGTAAFGGANGGGTIFRVSSAGNFQVLYSFDGTLGSNPLAGLIQANDGNFYGVTAWGGSGNAGVVFKMTLPGYAVTVLHTFDGTNGYPYGGLVQGSDGNLYGTTSATDDDNNPGGSVFRLSLAGDYAVLHTFQPWAIDGSAPESALMQHTNGILYGMTIVGGSTGKGTFFSLDEGLKPFVTYLPTYGRAGALVQILGQGFTSDSVVSFNGTPASSPAVVYPTYIRVFVPAGATSGPITVTTPSGTLTSNKVFIVHPN